MSQFNCFECSGKGGQNNSEGYFDTCEFCFGSGKISAQDYYANNVRLLMLSIVLEIDSKNQNDLWSSANEDDQIAEQIYQSEFKAEYSFEERMSIQKSDFENRNRELIGELTLAIEKTISFNALQHIVEGIRNRKYDISRRNVFNDIYNISPASTEVLSLAKMSCEDFQ